MIGDVVRVWIGGHHFLAFLEGGAYNQRVSVFAQSRQEFAARLECRRAV